MPSYKELCGQGLQANPAAYPLPARNSAGESVYIYQRVKWTGNFLDAELEHIEVPAHNCPSFTTTTQPEHLTPEDTPAIMLSSQSSFSKQVLAVPFPSAPQRDEKGLFPARPENLPTRPQRPSEDTVRERAFSKLITTERPLTVDEKIARDSQYLVELQKWRSWASRMPEEWNLLDPVEYRQLNSMMPTASESPVYKPNMDNDTQIFWLFLVFGVISYLCGAAAGQLLALALLAIAVVQINHQNSLDPVALFTFAVLNPISVIHLLGYWILGMIGVAVLVISSVVTSIFWLSNQVAASFAGANSGSRTAFSDATARLRDTKHDFVRDVSIPLLAPWLAAILLAVLNYKMLKAPSTGFLLACMLLCLFIAICIMASFIERPPSAVAGDPVIPPPTNPPATPAAQSIPAFHASTTLTGHSGVTYADPLATPQSVSIKSLPESLRPKPLIENFGTPIRGPLSKDFGARRTPEGLHTVQPSFFTTPPRPTFA
ncbi:hypothetical protein E4T48_00468 [Aureobasidium sp. EXF-10727]|nr:hypothetical protein E4T48_00468 [Aureobasidium sp. EXF-10727]KAI4729687.1 hypothetical protein E4T49_02521 [Aureobasidium sp. EXF-10728]